MKNIKNIEKVTSKYSTWKPSDIAYVKSFMWSANSLAIVFYCQLRGVADEWPENNKEFFEISMEFAKVRNLKLEFPGSGLHQITGFDIIDVSDNSLEGINFEIDDYESDSIAFSCEDVIVNVVSSPAMVAFD